MIDIFSTARTRHTYQTADFGSVLVQQQEIVGQFRQLETILCHVQDVRVHIDVVYSEGVDRQDLLELYLCIAEI